MVEARKESAWQTPRVSYEEMLAELYGLTPRGIRPGLDRVREALRRIGRPERELRVAHIAGTNGKGSTSAMIATGVAAAGGRVALYTSPHLASLTERVRILGGEPITRDELARAWSELRDELFASDAPPLTFFEALTVLALWVFRKREVDLAVLEVGLGGRLDATNVVAQPLVTAITRVGLDHANLLGNSLESVAREKAGILEPGVPVALGAQQPIVRGLLERAAREIGAPILEPVSIGSLQPRLAGSHQRENALVAATVLRALQARGIPVDVRAAIEDVDWPGRLEWAGRFLLDAAHNEDGCASLAAYLASRPRRRRVLLFGAMADKDSRAMLARLRPEVDALVFAAPNLSRAERPEALATAFGGVAADSIDRAIELAREEAGDGEVIVAGSIYLMGEVRARLLGLPTDPPIAM